MDKMEYLLENYNPEEEENEENEETNGRYTPVENDALISHDEYIESMNEYLEKQGRVNQPKLIDVEEKYEIPINLLFVGDSHVGKKNIITKYLRLPKTKGDPQNIKTFKKKIQIQREIIIDLTVFKISGRLGEKDVQEELIKLNHDYEIHHALIVFSLWKEEYLERIKYWIQILNDNYPISIVANKTLPLQEDLEKEKKKVKDEFPEIDYYHVIDFYGQNIDKMFESVYKKIIGDKNDLSNIMKRLNNVKKYNCLEGTTEVSKVKKVKIGCESKGCFCNIFHFKK